MPRYGVNCLCQEQPIDTLFSTGNFSGDDLKLESSDRFCSQLHCEISISSNLKWDHACFTHNVTPSSGIVLVTFGVAPCVHFGLFAFQVPLPPPNPSH